MMVALFLLCWRFCCSLPFHPCFEMYVHKNNKEDITFNYLEMLLEKTTQLV